MPALVLGIIAIAFFWVPILDMVASILAIILGARALMIINKYRLSEGKGYAMAGLILGIIATILWIVLLVMIFAAV